MPQYTKLAGRVMDEVCRAVIGKEDCVKKVLCAILAGGHVLIEDIPGVGKTTLALAFSRSMSMEQNRVQFTPDVLPGDIVGFSVYDKESGQFLFQPGAVMCNLFLADEINRTSPKTQSALLEVMEEGRVSVDKQSFEVPKPFVVIATENPAGSAGTQLLPESQLDRFLICISMGYPNIHDEIAIVKGNRRGNPADKVEPVIAAGELIAMQREVEEIYIHDQIYDYIGALVTATREHPMLRMGMSPRGTIALARMARAAAFLEGRDYVVPQDVQAVFPAVTRHRIYLNARARAGKASVEDVINEILGKVSAPAPRKQ